MFTKDTYTIELQFYRINERNDSSAIREDIVTSLILSETLVITDKFYTTICIPGSPVNFEYVGADIIISTEWTEQDYNIVLLDGIIPSSVSGRAFQSTNLINYPGSNTMTAHSAVADLNVKYWQSCKLACNELKFGPCWYEYQFQFLQKDFPLYVGMIILFIFIIVGSMMATGYMSIKTKYPC